MNAHTVYLLSDHLDADDFIRLAQASDDTRDSLMFLIKNIKLYYLFLSSKYPTRVSIIYDIPKYFIKKAVKWGRKDLVEYYTSNDSKLWNTALLYAAFYGKSIGFYLSKSTNYLEGLEGAIRSNRKNLVKFFMKKIEYHNFDKNAGTIHVDECLDDSFGKKRDPLFIDFLLSEEFAEIGFVTLFHPARNNDLPFINYLISKGCQNYTLGFEGAVLGNNLNLVKFFYQKMIDDSKIDIYIVSTNKEILDFIFTNIKHLSNLDKLLISARSGNEEYFNKFLKNNITEITSNIEIIRGIIKGGNENLINMRRKIMHFPIITFWVKHPSMVI